MNDYHFKTSENALFVGLSVLKMINQFLPHIDQPELSVSPEVHNNLLSLKKVAMDLVDVTNKNIISGERREFDSSNVQSAKLYCIRIDRIDVIWNYSQHLDSKYVLDKTITFLKDSIVKLNYLDETSGESAESLYYLGCVGYFSKKSENYCYAHQSFLIFAERYGSYHENTIWAATLVMKYCIGLNVPCQLDIPRNYEYTSFMVSKRLYEVFVPLLAKYNSLMAASKNSSNNKENHEYNHKDNHKDNLDSEFDDRGPHYDKIERESLCVTDPLSKFIDI